MGRKYIQNCTGDDCAGEKKSGNGGSSALVSRVVFFVLFFSFVSASVYVLFFSTYLQVLNVEVTGTKELSSGQLAEKLESSLQGKYLGIIPKNNFLFISGGSIERFLIDDFKKIRAVSVVKKFPDSVKVIIDERNALLVWCGGEKCYLLDENGIAYSEADFSSPELVQNNLLKIFDASGRTIAIGEQVVESAYEKYVLDMRGALAKTGLESSGEFFTPSRMSQEIRVKTNQGPELYFSMQFPLETAVFALSTVFAKEIPADKKGEIEYVDLRNENKVFYKFKNQPVSENQPTENPDVKKEEKKY